MKKTKTVKNAGKTSGGKTSRGAKMLKLDPELASEAEVTNHRLNQIERGLKSLNDRATTTAEELYDRMEDLHDYLKTISDRVLSIMNSNKIKPPKDEEDCMDVSHFVIAVKTRDDLHKLKLRVPKGGLPSLYFRGWLSSPNDKLVVWDKDEDLAKKFVTKHTADSVLEDLKWHVPKYYGKPFVMARQKEYEDEDSEEDEEDDSYLEDESYLASKKK